MGSQWAPGTPPSPWPELAGRTLGILDYGHSGRAEVVDESALYRALAERRIAGAALDVWYRYPGAAPTLPSREPFHELANVLMTPHVSGWTDGMLAARMRLIAENIRRTAEGLPPANLVPRG